MPHRCTPTTISEQKRLESQLDYYCIEDVPNLIPSLYNEKALKHKPSLVSPAGACTQPEKITSKQCVLSQQLVSLAFSSLHNLPTKSLHVVSHIIFAHRPISYLLVPLSEHVSQRYCLHIFWGENLVTFQAIRFIDKLLSRITSENATFPIHMPHFVVIELVISDLWPFEAVILGN